MAVEVRQLQGFCGLNGLVMLWLFLGFWFVFCLLFVWLFFEWSFDVSLTELLMEISQLPIDCFTLLLVPSLRLLQKYLPRCIFFLIEDIPHLILTHLYLPLRLLFLFGRGDLDIAVVAILLQVSSVDLALVVAYFFVDFLDPLVHLVVILGLFLAGLVLEVPI